MTPAELKALVRTVPDHPVPGIQFRDITPLIAHGDGFAATVEWLSEALGQASPAAIAGLEARGFIFGAAVAARMRLPFITIRKGGKLPCRTIGIDYHLEYGHDRLELDPEAIPQGSSVVIIDDLLATGGTALAAAELLRQGGATVHVALFVIELPDLGGRKRLGEAGVDVHTLMAFEGD